MGLSDFLYKSSNPSNSLQFPASVYTYQGWNWVSITDVNDLLIWIVIWVTPILIKVEECAEAYISGITNWFGKDYLQEQKVK